MSRDLDFMLKIANTKEMRQKYEAKQTACKLLAFPLIVQGEPLKNFISVAASNDIKKSDSDLNTIYPDSEKEFWQGEL